MNSHLLFTIYHNARKVNHNQVKLPDIKPKYQVINIQPIRNHHNAHSFG